MLERVDFFTRDISAIPVRRQGGTTRENPRRSNRPAPNDSEDLTDRAVALLDHRAPLIVAAALMLLTGRRKIEILRTGNLSALPAGAKVSENAPPEHTLVFDGQAETRGAVSAQTAPYPIPVLAEPQLVLDASHDYATPTTAPTSPTSSRARTRRAPRDRKRALGASSGR